MIIHSQDGIRGKLFDEAAGRKIPLPIWFDTDTGRYEAFRTLDGMEPLRAAGIPLRYQGQARLRFVADPPRPILRPGAPPVDDALKERARKGIRIPAGFQECDTPRCHRLATWYVGDEQLVEPEIGRDGKPYERAVVVTSHFLCDGCYRLPVSTSLRGVESEVQIGLRPEWRSV